MSDINMPAILSSNLITAALCISIMFSKCKRIRLVSFDDKLFFTMCAITLTQAILEPFSFYFDGRYFNGIQHVLTVLNVIIFFLASMMALVWFTYIHFKLFGDMEKLKKQFPLFSAPILTVCVLELVNLFIPIFFYITESGEYVRMPLFPLAIFANYLYMTVGVALSWRNRKHLGKYVFVPTVLFLAPIYIGAALQIYFYGLSFMWVGTALGLNALYINLQNEESYIDPLTGLYNRSYLFSYLESINSKHQKLSGMMIDLNSFKKINDTYGHTEGDNALRAVGKLLIKNLDEKYIISRYAGDEFVILSTTENEDMLSLKNHILNCVDEYNMLSKKPYKLSFSIGCCTMSEQNVDDFFVQIDRAMYDDKKLFYSDHAQERRH